MSVRILSWNMQGGGRQKIDYIGKYLGQYNILCLQEGGSSATGFINGDTVTLGGHRLICVSAIPHEGCLNARCTTGIFVEESMRGEVGNIRCIGRIRERPMLSVDVHGLQVSTVHAIANDAESVPEVKMLLDELNKIGNKWVLVGDFNSTPERYPLETETVSELNNSVIKHIRYAGTASRYEGHTCWINYSKSPTQGASGGRNKVLDFAFIGESAGRFDYICNEKVTDGAGNVISDHNIVYFDIDW